MDPMTDKISPVLADPAPADQITDSTDPVEQLSRILAGTRALFAGVREDQLNGPTPCQAWTVGALVNHVVYVLRQFALRAAGGTADWTGAVPEVGADRVVVFQSVADDLLAGWRKAGDLVGTIELPGMGTVPARFPLDQELTEIAVHSWDLARATGQPIALDEQAARSALDWSRVTMLPEYRDNEDHTGFVGPELPVAANAPVWDQLAAFSGRAPDWSPPAN
jgi:uncharacterized protein (TIGR03086 family)